MTMRALVVDDDPEIVRTVEDILDSHGHAHVSAGDVASARERFADERFDYVILDLDLPAKPGRYPRLDNGRNLLEHLRAIPGHARTPVIVITGRGTDADQAVSVMKTGNSNYTDYVLKPLDGGKLDKAIGRVLKMVASDGSPPEPPKAPELPKAATVDKPPVPFDAEPREMVIYDDRITVCDVELWSDHAQSDLREVFVRLSARDGAGYVRIRGEKLGKLLKRDPSNPIARPIKDFRDRATEKLRSVGIDCGRYDIIRSNDGYQLTEAVTVRIVRGSEAHKAHEPASPRNEPPKAHKRNEPPKAHEPHPFARHEPAPAKAHQAHEPASLRNEPRVRNEPAKAREPRARNEPAKAHAPNEPHEPHRPVPVEPAPAKAHHAREPLVGNEPAKAHEPHPQSRRAPATIAPGKAREPADEPHEPAATNGELNERQRWVLSQLADGVPLRFRDIVRYTKKKRATINRDLKGLRDMGLIATHAEGHYIACRPTPPRTGSG